MLRSDWLWIGWFAGGLASFAVLEAAALGQYPDVRHTFTVRVRRWLGIYPVMPRRVTSSIGVVGALGMVAAHVLVDPPEGHRWADGEDRRSVVDARRWFADVGPSGL